MIARNQLEHATARVRVIASAEVLLFPLCLLCPKTVHQLKRELNIGPAVIFTDQQNHGDRYVTEEEITPVSGRVSGKPCSYVRRRRQRLGQGMFSFTGTFREHTCYTEMESESEVPVEVSIFEQKNLCDARVRDITPARECLRE